MALFVKQTPQKGRVYLQIVDGIYDKKTKNTKHKVYKKLGYLDELEKDYKDPIAYFKDWCNKENERLKGRDFEPIPTKTSFKNLGYFPFKQLYKQLLVGKIVNNFQFLIGDESRYKLSDVFEPLVYSRILNPTSKLETYESFLDTLVHEFNFSKAQMYDAIELLGQDNGAIFEGMRLMMKDYYRVNLSNVYFDATNFYFEIDKPNDLAKLGPSKENRKNPIIGLGLLLDGDSIPLDYHIYPGNESEIPVARKVLEQMKEKNEITGKVIRIADKGINSKDNIADAYLAGDGYIFSQSIRGAKEKLKDYILNEKGYRIIENEDGEVIYKIKSRIDYEAEITVTDINGKKKKVNIPQKQIVFWSKDYSEKSKVERDRALLKTDKQLKVESIYKRDKYGFTSKYVNEDFIDEDGNIVDVEKIKSLNEEKIAYDESLDGYYLIVTSELKEKDDTIIEAYKTLWEIEESFRIMKSQLKTRPVYHSNLNAIRGHFLICMTALLFIRIVEKKKLKGKISSSQLIKSLRKYSATKLSDDKYQLHYYDENLNLMSQYYSKKLNQHYKTEKEIKEIFT